MTATDRAFIRLFDHTAGSEDFAPHVVFAAGGMQLAEYAGVAVAEASEGRDERHAPMTGDATSTAAPAKATRATGAEAPAKQRPAQRNPSTYLPSAFRNLVGLEVGPRDTAVSVSNLRGPTAARNGAESFERRPLDEVVQEPRPNERFSAALEVDALRWPAVVERLNHECPEELEILRSTLLQAIQRDERVITFQSTHRGAGSTTLALASGRLLAAEGHEVVVVDADFLKPGLASAVGLAIDEGWEKALVNGAALAETMIRSLGDGITIVPLAKPLDERWFAGETLGDQVVSDLNVLREYFDVVLVDSGSSGYFARPGQGQWRRGDTTLDAYILVHSNGQEIAGSRDAPPLESRLPLIGIVENLVTTTAA